MAKCIVLIVFGLVLIIVGAVIASTPTFAVVGDFTASKLIALAIAGVSLIAGVISFVLGVICYRQHRRR